MGTAEKATLHTCNEMLQIIIDGIYPSINHDQAMQPYAKMLDFVAIQLRNVEHGNAYDPSAIIEGMN